MIDKTMNQECETTKDVDALRKSVWQQYKYDSSWVDNDEERCIICNKDIRVKGRLLPPKTISTVDKAEPALKKFAEIHIKNNNLKYVEGAKWIPLNKKIFIDSKCRSTAWRRGKNVIVKLI